VVIREWVPQVAVPRDLCETLAARSHRSPSTATCGTRRRSCDTIGGVEADTHRRKLQRFEAAGHVRYLTFSCYRRLPLLKHDAIRELFIKRVAIVCETQHVRLLAWVIMPEHVHLLVFPESEPDLERFTHAVKRPVAEAVLRRWKKLEAPILKKIAHGTGYRYWQTGGGYDRNVFTPEGVLKKIEYTHNNPLRRGLVENATEYAWSSARWYARHADAKLPCSDLPW
jgi:putative transposase